ncbi:methylated-DNA-protein-cysteine methyltransferase related protein [Cytobacillus horneckiae]|uniref:Cysteine methyltransferase n=1 Tax=Cytobacillus horneckiae TaxID=549687 RepID=A0A2N0ZI62_9BACI|nr:MGMT family protein [Cytobacillus horneckiae]NRG47678.1 MGMT family protein [Bacillus sp. CRN 9]MBN6886839.1 MGMT family protein [Cytobacillus horneckiae]MCM3177690.1 MGMT family protein [Cytobacillus horneckiae]MEC1158005.1 MGMT family protein [Cytobacillus horneckiae]MED2937070.1 MGMT family protein [Cytobacillus horneckiae]
MEPFTARVIEAIKHIPPGTVMTYGQIARIAGSPRAARQVARVLHSMSRNYQLPWHRVVNKDGKIMLSDPDQANMQQYLLESEGILFLQKGIVELAKYQYQTVT